MLARDIYEGSEAGKTRAYYAELERLGAAGRIARTLMAAQKASARAKVYRGGVGPGMSYRHLAYQNKQKALDILCGELYEHADGLGITWGWKQDPNVLIEGLPSWVVYAELPSGQVSFHCLKRGNGPPFQGDWDGQHASAARIIAYCDRVWATPRPDQQSLFA